MLLPLFKTILITGRALTVPACFRACAARVANLGLQSGTNVWFAGFALQENCLADLAEESASDLADSPAPPDSPGEFNGATVRGFVPPANSRAAPTPTAVAGGQKGEGVGGIRQEDASDGANGTAALMSPPALSLHAGVLPGSRRAAGVASAANAAAMLRL